MKAPRLVFVVGLVGAAGLYLASRTTKGQEVAINTVGAAVEAFKPRGIRNNNPGNIKASGDQWQGAAGKDSGGFLIFEAPHWGIRAMAKTLKTYADRHNLRTINGIVSRWAPATDKNDVASYSRSVSQRSGLQHNQTLGPGDYLKLVPAMIYHENGQQPYTPAQILEGVRAAGWPV